jgi:type I restriction-modification system DNA methylase subunit
LIKSAAAPVVVEELVERFERNHQSYVGVHYNEAQTRREFIDPLFKALGWDVDNSLGYSELYKDVVHEYSLRGEGAAKSPDYSFRIGGSRRFFVEAKRPAANLKEEPTPSYQLRRYGWSAKLPLSVLTNFGQLCVYDCTYEPNVDDKASTARVEYWTARDYLTAWDKIAGLLSKEAVLKGAFDTYVKSSRSKRGTAEVDVAFLGELQSWRGELAKNVALRNPGLSQRQLNFAVQQTIDRIVFLRICEDRAVEPYGQLQTIAKGADVYQRLVGLFRKADERYNSGLFHFRTEERRFEKSDELTLGLVIDDKFLRDIVTRLYYPESPYEFSVLPADILGQVYEQFLGQVIRLTSGHRAVIEDKPEVRKAGGVYYTPTHIVSYIVRNTLGPLVEGASPRDIAGTAKRSKALSILDPACGSGSFLINAYQFLLDWHLDWYLHAGADKWARGSSPKLRIGPAGAWRLTTMERKRILLTHIYGVDIDPQAVEVSKLSLLLKVLEGESDEAIDQQMLLFHERALPDLGANIKCGNSLIEPDFYENEQLSLLGDEDQFRINMFDWSAEFKAIMSAGGFSVVIGNPPWLMAGYYLKDSLDYLKRRYETATGKYDLYYLFLEQGLRLLSDSGRLGMIVPNKFFHTEAAKALRSLLGRSRSVRHIVDFGAGQVFPRATNYSCILLLEPDAAGISYTRATPTLRIIREYDVPRSLIGASPWVLVDSETRRLFKKLETNGQELADLTLRFGTGVQTGSDPVFLVDPDKARELGLEQHLLRPMLRGRDVRQYYVAGDHKVLVFPYKIVHDEFQILSEAELKQYPNTYRYLTGHREGLASRVWFGKTAEQLSGKWYGLMYLDNQKYFAAPHLLTPSLSDKSNFAIGTGALFATGTAGVTSIVPAPDISEDRAYLLAILNSKLLSFYAISHSPVFSGEFYKFSSPYLRYLPIRRIEFDSSEDVAIHSRLIDLSHRAATLRQRRAGAQANDEAVVLERQISLVGAEIDRAVYKLYGLTTNEVAMIERMPEKLWQEAVAEAKVS